MTLDEQVADEQVASALSMEVRKTLVQCRAPPTIACVSNNNSGCQCSDKLLAVANTQSPLLCLSVADPIRALIISLLVIDLIGWFASAVALVSYSGNPTMQSMLVDYGLPLFFWRAAETIGVMLMH